MNTHLLGELKRGLFNNKCFLTCFILRSATSFQISSSLHWQKAVIQHPGTKENVKEARLGISNELVPLEGQRQIVYENDHCTGPRLCHGYLVSHADR